MDTHVPIEGHLLARARRHLRAGQYSSAHDVLSRLDTADARLLLGECCLKLRRRGAARRHLRAAARLRPDHARTHALRGHAAASPAAAARHYRRALVLAPRDAGVRSRAGLALLRSGDHDAGLDLLREASRQSGAFGVLRRLVLGLCEAGLPNEAERAILAARFAAPRCPRRLGLLGKLRAGRLQAAPVDDGGPVLLAFVPVERAPRADAAATVLPGPHSLRIRRGPALGRV